MTHASGQEIEWEDGHPVSRRFGDVYFSRDSGIEETRHVFLAGNRLEERWATLPPGARFTIGETGFGTGLNFCAAWQLWERTAPQDAVVRYVSIERFPVASDEMARALAMWPELAPYSTALEAQYTEHVPGWHRFHFADGRVILTLAIGDAATMLGELAGYCDAWFLDGFAPAKNPVFCATLARASWYIWRVLWSCFCLASHCSSKFPTATSSLSMLSSTVCRFLKINTS